MVKKGEKNRKKKPKKIFAGKIEKKFVEKLRKIFSKHVVEKNAKKM